VHEHAHRVFDQVSFFRTLDLVRISERVLKSQQTFIYEVGVDSLALVLENLTDAVVNLSQEMHYLSH